MPKQTGNVEKDVNGVHPTEWEIDAARERILIYGQMTSGKTYSLLNLVDLIQMADPTAKIWVIDADRGIGKIKVAEFPQLEPFDYKVIKVWEDVEDWVAEVGPLQKPKDWVLIDMLGRFWEMAQSTEVSTVHGVSVGQRMMQSRKSLMEEKKMHAPGTLPQVDWTVIKRLHNDEFIDRVTVGWDCNIVATTSADELSERDDALIVSIFSEIGYKPDGEKRNAHRFDTVIHLESLGRGIKRKAKVAKDRGRPPVDFEFTQDGLWTSFANTLATKGYIFANGLIH